MNSQLSRQFIWLSLMMLILALTPQQAGAQEVGGTGIVDDLIIQWDAASPITELQSGEVTVRTSAVFLSREGHPYGVRLSFQNRADYDAALAAGAKGLHLGNLESVWSLRTPDEVEQLAHPQAKTVLDLASQAASLLCGNVAARGVARLEGGVFVGVSLLAPPTKVTAVAERDIAHDIHDACDLFAAGGCGSDTCYNSFLEGGVITILSGSCKELEIWGPNSCYCSATTIVSRAPA